jgi:chorismate mutase
MDDRLQLQSIRNILIRQEETIIFSMVERAQFKQNQKIYQPDVFPIIGYSGSFLEYLLLGTERLHSTVRRYQSPDEYPFFDQLPKPVLPDLPQDTVIKKNRTQF